MFSSNDIFDCRQSDARKSNPSFLPCVSDFLVDHDLELPLSRPSVSNYGKGETIILGNAPSTPHGLDASTSRVVVLFLGHPFH